MIDQPSPIDDARRRTLLRGAALVQFALALPCAFYALLFILATPHGHDELGLSRSFEPAFGASTAAATILLAYGGWLAWRAARRWWLPGLLAILGTPVLLVVLFLIGLSSPGT